MAKTRDKIEETVLCTGVKLSDSFFEKKENRLFTIFLKGFVVYLVSMGSIGFYLSSFDIEYNVFFCHIAIFVVAMICALLYYRLLVENLGYLLLLAAFALLVHTYRIIINSGFYAIVNITVENASNYFGQSFQRIYTEQISDRYMTITYVVLFIGIVLDILLNVYISRRMQYFTAIFIVMGLNMIPLYITEEPDNMYVIMFLAGIAMTYIYKSGRHYGPQVSGKRNDFIFEKKKRELSYKYDVKAMLQAGVIAIIFVVVGVNVITAFKPKETFNVGYKTNKYKELTMVGVSTLLLDGFEGFFRRSNDTGGLMGGKLGAVSSLKLDHETDLRIKFTPYSYDTVYLKGFTGALYNPYDNAWTDASQIPEDNYHMEYCPEARAFENDFVQPIPGAYTARGIMNILYIDVGSQMFFPYYTSGVDVETPDGSINAEYYPRLEGNNIVTDKSYYPDGKPYVKHDLSVPEVNYYAVKNFVDRLELDEDSTLDDKIMAIKDYYQANFPYTIKPGKTPDDKDFVNYFLEENQKGYCAHFASAATLMFRYMDIPARYVEGYAVDYYQMTTGELVEGAYYHDYYEGYSELGKTALVELNVTDADAHAWVEVYDEDFGWRVVDVTPMAESEEENEDFWEAFDKFVEENPDSVLNTGVNGGGLMNIKIPNSLIRKLCYILLGIVGIIIAVFIVWRIVIAVTVCIRYSRATINDKLIMKYSAKCKKIRRFNKEFAGMYNYREQVEYFGSSNENIISILERAGFSDEKISEAEYSMVVEWMKSLSFVRKHEEEFHAGE